jgi:hypothetical protein
MGKARARSSPLNLVLDAGALIALERGDGKMIALLHQAQKRPVCYCNGAGSDQEDVSPRPLASVGTKPHDNTHEREWRAFGDVDFASTTLSAAASWV